jgi:hypothetical protein
MPAEFRRPQAALYKLGEEVSNRLILSTDYWLLTTVNNGNF